MEFIDHMTNSNTPIEALEYASSVSRALIRVSSSGSGGEGGQFRGGLDRGEIELLAPSQVTLLCDRHKFAPYGLSGGGDGAMGRVQLMMKAMSQTTDLPAKCTTAMQVNDVIRVETPGWRRMGQS